MPVVVVDAFKTIEIADDDRNGTAGCADPERLIEGVIKIAAVVEARSAGHESSFDRIVDTSNVIRGTG